MWYNVGSKDEPKGKTGFAHLFEHLMFNGIGESARRLFHLPAADRRDRLQRHDLVRPDQLFPDGADAARSSARCSWKATAWAICSARSPRSKLDNQRGVVQNEKRQGDNQPGGLVVYEVLENLFPDGHPYHHSTIGSMADLDAASLARRQATGSATNMARTMPCWCWPATSTPRRRGRWSRNISAPSRAARSTMPAAADVPTLAAPKSMRDEGPRRDDHGVRATGRCPGLLDRPARRARRRRRRCSAASPARGSTRSWSATRRSRSASAPASTPFQRVGLFYVQATVKPGVDPARRREAARRDHRRLSSPTARPRTRCARAATRDVARPDPRARAGRRLRRQGGDAGRGRSSTPATATSTRRRSPAYAAITPAEVQAAMPQWLTRPAFALRLEPGERAPYVEAAVAAKAAKAADKIAVDEARARCPGGRRRCRRSISRRRSMPRLSNGVAAALRPAQRRSDHPDGAVVRRRLSPPTRRPAAGSQSMTLSLLDEGTPTAQRRSRSPKSRSGSARRSAPAASARPSDGRPVGAVAPTWRRRSTCWPTSSATRPSRRPRSSGCGRSS